MQCFVWQGCLTICDSYSLWSLHRQLNCQGIKKWTDQPKSHGCQERKSSSLDRWTDEGMEGGRERGKEREKEGWMDGQVGR